MNQSSSKSVVSTGPTLVDALLPVFLFLVAVMSVLPSLRHGGSPVEDAAMLLRYSDHVAHHQGITWNAGEHPVEGATDFLYMMTIAGVAKLLHVDALRACRLLLFSCSALLPLVIFTASRWTLRANRWLALALGLYIAAVPSGTYLVSGFGVPFMMLVTALATWAGLAMIADRGTIRWSSAFLFALLALAIGLTRPEGNAMAVLLLLSLCVVRGVRESGRLILAFGAVFLVLGGSYFLWRLHYFGYLLPNPFYVKGGGHLHLQGLSHAVENALKIVWPVLALSLLALRNRTRTRLLVAMLIPVVGFTLIWVLLSNENNHYFRFQMPLLPVALLYLPLLLEGLWPELSIDLDRLSSGAKLGLQGAAIVCTVGLCAGIYKAISSPIPAHNAQVFAKYLGGYADRGYTMAVTEAGTFPYFSGWKAIDLLGLNDATIAHHGLSEEYLDRYKPELILYHLYTPPTGSGINNRDNQDVAHRDIHAMSVAHAYAVHHNYVLAAVLGGEPCSVHYFYVRPNTPDTEAIVQYIRTTPYYFLDTGLLSADYRTGVRPECNLPDFGN